MKPIAWYDPTNGMVSTDKDSPLFTPLGQLLPLYTQQDAKDEPWEQFYPEMGKPKLAYLPPTESLENACYIPPQRTWAGLTKEERHEISLANKPYVADIMAAHEEELKRRNT
jgi:hypothetical protein